MTLSPFVNLASAAGGVYITANTTLTSNGTDDRFFANSIAFIPATGDAFTLNQINAVGSCLIIFNLCVFNPTAGNSLTATGIGTPITTIYQNNCQSFCQSGFKLYDITGILLNVNSCNNTNHGSTASTIDGGVTFGGINIAYSKLYYIGASWWICI